MKPATITGFFCCLLILYSCSKSNDPAPFTQHCDGLITDTLGTGDPAKIYMPTAFTPNSDGINENVRPYTQFIASLNFIVYDSTGTILFSTNQLGDAYRTSPAAENRKHLYFRIQATTIANHRIGRCGDLYQFNCRPANAADYDFEDQLNANGFVGVTNDIIPNCP